MANIKDLIVKYRYIIGFIVFIVLSVSTAMLWKRENMDTEILPGESTSPQSIANVPQLTIQQLKTMTPVQISNLRRSSSSLL